MKNSMSVVMTAYFHMTSGTTYMTPFLPLSALELSMKNSIAKIIHFMRHVVEEAPSPRYNMTQDKDGRAVFLDIGFRIEVKVGVNQIIVNQYAITEDKSLLESVTYEWEELTTRQKTDIIEIMDDAGDGEPDERDDAIERIFK